MARLRKGESESKQKRVLNVLKSNALGTTEMEAADLLGLEQRTMNNYLRKLQKLGKAGKKGRSWFGAFDMS